MHDPADEPTAWERTTATPAARRRFNRRSGPPDPTMPHSTLPTERSACLAVVPAYNEEATVGRVIEALHARAPQLDVVVVDDGSTDATGECAEEAGARVLRMPFNLGIGGAVQAGFKFADEQGYDYMVQVDADGQHDPGEIKKLFAAMDGPDPADMICGTRFATPTGYMAPISRRTGIHLFAFLLSRLLGQPVTDPTSGFRLYNRRAIAVFARDYPHDYPEVEAVLMLHHHRLTMREVPVRMFKRGGGVSSITGSGKSFYYMVKVLLALFVGLGRRRAVPEPGEAAAVAADHGI
jgi:glycosyltransferase involved in cell wall biosynthesis